MRIPKRDLKKLKSIYYNSADDVYYFEDENGNYLYDELMSEHEYKDTVDTINDLVESYFILTGSVGLWDGTRTVVPYVCKNFDDLTRKMKDINDIEISFDEDEQAIVIKGYHHDGTNVYYLRKPEWYTKNELKQLILEINDYDRKQINEDTQIYFGVPFSRLNRYEVHTILESEYLERC